MAEISSVLITGANRGIGLEFVKQFLTNPLVRTQTVIAACRSPDQATALQELKKNYTQLHVIKLDVASFDSHESVVNEVRNIVGDKGLTLLINNAGVNSNKHTLEDVTPDDFAYVFKINSIAPVFVTKAFLPLLKLSAQVNSGKSSESLSVTRAAVINIGSLLGSVALNNKGFWAYKESKASLNMSSQSLASELEKDGILVEVIHPGHVLTDMGGKTAAIDTVTSVTGMLEVFLQLKGKNTKGFPSWNGEDLPY